MEIKKAGFYKNWFDLANGLQDTDRLAFYDMIFNYYFIQEEPAENAPQIIKTLFLAVRANIEADLKRKRAGAPEGNHNAKKQLIDLISENNSKQLIDLKKTNKVKVKVNDNVNDKVNVKVNDELNNINFDNIIRTLETAHDLKISAKSKNNIYSFMDAENLTCNYLNFVYEYIHKKYPDKTAEETSGLFIAAATDWPDLLKQYRKSHKPAAKKSKIVYKTQPPKTCTFCGSATEPGALTNTVECPKCRSDGFRTWWEYDGEQWQANR